MRAVCVEDLAQRRFFHDDDDKVRFMSRKTYGITALSKRRAMS